MHNCFSFEVIQTWDWFKSISRDQQWLFKNLNTVGSCTSLVLLEMLRNETEVWKHFPRVCLSIIIWFIVRVSAAGTSKGYAEACDTPETFVWDLKRVSFIWRWLGNPASRLFSRRTLNKRSSPASLLLSALLLSFVCSPWTITPSCPPALYPPHHHHISPPAGPSFRSVPFIVCFAVIQVVTVVQCEPSLRPH